MTTKDEILSESGVLTNAPTADSLGTIAIGNDSYEVRADGTVTVIPRQRVYAHIEGLEPVLHQPDIATIDGIPITAGVNVILGVANVGKSPLLRYIAGKQGVRLIEAQEPFAGSIRGTDQLAAAILQAHESPIICVDSFKNVVRRMTGGGTMISGISGELLPWLSDMSSYFAERGQAIVTALNFSVARKEVIDEMISGLSSNVSALWVMDKSGIKWSVRGQAGKMRRSGDAKPVWIGDGEIGRLDGSASRESSPRNEGGIHSTYIQGTPIGTASPLGRAVARLAARQRAYQQKP